jgi:hypothetical protein
MWTDQVRWPAPTLSIEGPVEAEDPIEPETITGARSLEHQVQEEGMQMFTRHTLVALAMAVGVCGVAMAHDDDGRACSLITLRGSYVFAANGFNIVGGIAQPKAIVEVIDFNGDGTLSVPAATRSVNGVVAQIPPGGVGDYTVEAGCTGTLAFIGGPSFDIFIAPGGNTLWMIQTNPNTVLQGTATRLARSNIATGQ